MKSQAPQASEYLPPHKFWQDKMLHIALNDPNLARKALFTSPTGTRRNGQSRARFLMTMSQQGQPRKYGIQRLGSCTTNQLVRSSYMETQASRAIRSPKEISQHRQGRYFWARMQKSRMRITARHRNCSVSP